ncbi:hypothetical protein [Sorangium cellulosum]|nr:hypothetical protein [Sorangium cellulosum]
MGPDEECGDADVFAVSSSNVAAASKYLPTVVRSNPVSRAT